MKEVLKEIAPGVFTHDYWVDDDDGNRIPEPAPPAPEPTDEQVTMAIVLDLYAALEAKGVI